MIQKEWPGSSENTRKKEMEQSGHRDREGKKKELSGRNDLGYRNVSSMIVPRCVSSDVLNLSSDKSSKLCSEGRILEGIPVGSGICRGCSSCSSTSSSSPRGSGSSTCGG